MEIEPVRSGPPARGTRLEPRGGAFWRCQAGAESDPWAYVKGLCATWHGLFGICLVQVGGETDCPGRFVN